MDAARVRSTVFVGTTRGSESLGRAIQVNLDRDFEVVLWTQGFFEAGAGILECLERKLDHYDFAIIVLTPDDFLITRGQQGPTSRANLIYELGLFTGRLGRERVFALCDRSVDMILPSDLDGVTQLRYEMHASGNTQAALGAACTEIAARISKLGMRKERLLEQSIAILGLSVRARECLGNHGIQTVKELAESTPEELLSIKYINRPTIKDIRDRLEAHDVNWRIS